MIGDNDFTLADTDASPVTGAVTATVAASDPEGKKLTYSLTSGPAVGSLVFNKTTGVFTYTPTAAQRIQAALPGGVTPASFTVTVSDGKTKVVAPVSVAIEPTQLTDIGALPAGEGALGLAVTNTRAYITNRDAGTITVIDTINRSLVDRHRRWRLSPMGSLSAATAARSMSPAKPPTSLRSSTPPPTSHVPHRLRWTAIRT